MAENISDDDINMQRETARVLEEDIIDAIANISISDRNVKALSETSKTPVYNVESADDHLPKPKGIDILKDLFISLNSATLKKADSNLSSFKSYLQERILGFPDESYFTGLTVELENYVFKYKLNNFGAIKNIRDKLRISLLKRNEFYYGNLLNEAKEEDEAALLRLREYGGTWLKIGSSREQLDFFIKEFLESIVVNGGFNIEVTHNRLFDEGIKGNDGEMMSQKLELPISQHVPVESAPSSCLHGPNSSLPSSSQTRQPVPIPLEQLFPPFRALYLQRQTSSIPPPPENDQDAMDED